MLDVITVADFEAYFTRHFGSVATRKPSRISDATDGFTRSQRIAYRGILNAILNKTHTGALLCGYAGCGKTYLAQHLIQALEQHGRRVALCAPTHKAVQILNRALAGKVQAEAMTVHALLGMRLTRYHDGSQRLEQDTQKNRIHDFDVIVVDECSMIDRHFFDLLRRSRTFVLFLGDSAQLPPVASNQSSPVFDSHELARFTLSEVVRQKGDSPILKLAEAIRNHEETPFAVKDLSRYADGCALQVFTKSTFNYTWEGSGTRILAWRNQTVDKYNTLLHGVLFQSADKPYTAGERIVLQSSIQTQKGDHTILLSNGVEGIIQSVEDAPHPDWPDIPAWKMQVIMEYATIYHDADEKTKENVSGVSATLWVPKDMQSVKNQSENYFLLYRVETSRKNNQKAVHYSALGWKLRDDFANIKHAYSSTVHKSQGSTYDTAIVDVSDLTHPKAKAVFNRLLYTAVTRPRTKLLMIV